MIFTPTELPGTFVVDLERAVDERGWFARAWCHRELAEHGLTASLAQCSLSHNARAGTLRGLHYQAHPHEEAKLVRCVRGAVFDVVVDIRSDSPTRGRWVGVELSEENGRAVFVPEGAAHGFQTLTDDTVLFYAISVEYEPAAARGARWDDPAFGIEWPRATNRVISERDRAWPDFDTDVSRPRIA